MFSEIAEIIVFSKNCSFYPVEFSFFNYAVFKSFMTACFMFLNIKSNLWTFLLNVVLFIKGFSVIMFIVQMDGYSNGTTPNRNNCAYFT